MQKSDRRAIVMALAAMTAAACSSEKAPDPVAVAPAEDRIECALAGATEFGRDCSVERIAADEGTDLIIHHRDGGFRRLRLTGQGVVADGAEQPTVSEAGDQLEISLGGDRYRLPATEMGAPEPAV